MSVKNVIKMGTSSLVEPSKPVTHFNTSELNTLIKDLKDTMYHDHGVGIAAPQIGCNLQVIVFGFENNPRYPNEKPIPETILINPKITILSKETEEFWEGCLSIPGLRGVIPRPTTIKYSGYTATGEVIERKVTGFHARVVQHEIDHINGRLLPSRLKNWREFAFEDVLKREGIL